jgi:hypothetical protein
MIGKTTASSSMARTKVIVIGIVAIALLMAVALLAEV